MPLLDALPPPSERVLSLAVASARDDASPLAPSAYALTDGIPGDDGALLYEVSLLVRLEAPSGSCRGAPDPGQRFGAWSPEASVLGWPCDESTIVDQGIFERTYVDYGYQACPSRPIVMAESGEAMCAVTAYTTDLGPCDPARGWVDPKDASGVRRATLVENNDGTVRACEVRQLEGAALDACRTSPACDGCSSGWCKATGKLGISHCPPGDVAPNLRFPGGALAGAPAILDITCDLMR